MPRLLVVHHSPTAAMAGLTAAVLAGAREEPLGELGVEVRELEALAFARGEADHHDLLDADAYVLGTPANFGTMSGALKHVFDSTFWHLGGALDDDGGVAPASSGPTSGRPYGLYLHGRYDLTGAVRSVRSLAGALGWRQGHEVVGVLGEADAANTASAHDLGATIAALLTG